MIDLPVRRLPWAGEQAKDVEPLVTGEWLLANGLGGYAGGSISGVITRRYHGLLVAALPTGRTNMFTHVWERLRLPDRSVVVLSDEENASGPLLLQGARYLTEFRLELGLPVWRYDINGFILEKRIVLVHRQNTVHVSYRLLTGEGSVRLTLRPSVHFRDHHAPVNAPVPGPFPITAVEDRLEIGAGPELPPLRLTLHGVPSAFTIDGKVTRNVLYRIERARGYEHTGELWSPGYFRLDLKAGESATLIGSTERWEVIRSLDPEAATRAERERRVRLLAAAPPDARSGPAAELVLAADQFIVTPPGRVEEMARARAAGEEARSVIAGYHWFTDWGRDTMISLDGLLFPEGERQGLYHTADATLWFFHAIDRYLAGTDDRLTRRLLLPRLRDIVAHHLAGTRFGIGVEPRDGLLRQGAPGYQLTWMDAKVGDWVVTPRRGKAVEINALWYNALRLLEAWENEEGDAGAAKELARHADRARAAFNDRFWYAAGGYCYDVVDGESGDDPACRPNQILAVSLRHPVLDVSRWKPMLDVVTDRLLTPVGLRSLAPDHPDYKSRYDGDLRARDAAYHQGTVWAWLIGPFVDVWLRVYPDDRAGARRFVEGFVPHLGEACFGSISEVFDAEEPFRPRGCVGQAWSVAEVLRAWLATAPAADASPRPR
ncbi:MAG: glycogen debranching protein [Candidatus Rokubacteria bacterium 13_1_40CM_68_15]|nr:MAG: glycogen debranching protein [Candidatus Rokubacteria bacterium 13_1_40CM_68_15]